MKTLFTFFALFLAVTIVQAQQFEKTDAYFVTLQNSLGEDDAVSASAIIYTDDVTPIKITTIPVVDTKLINKINITQLNSVGLNGVRKVLKVEIQYIEYCSYYVSNYILETDKGGYITLPMVTNEDCGDTDTEIVYLFPTQKFGKENEILTSAVSYYSQQIIDAELENSFIWNDDNYGTSGHIYEEL